MPTIAANGIDICYEEKGSKTDPALLLVMGFTGQMTAWDEMFVDLLVGRGFRVIRYDNRDCGLTSKTPGNPPRMISSDGGVAGVDGPAPYTLVDMAADGMALLSALGIDKAHVVGASMGGMIVQQMAIDHPERVLSLTSIMSTTSAPGVGQAKAEAMTALLTPPPTDRDAYVEHSVNVGRIVSGSLFDEDLARTRAAKAYDRAFYPQGAAFQMAAIMATGDRTDKLRSLDVPTLVIHGRIDPLITLSGGEATAAAIPGAELLVLDPMGHDMPRPLLAEIADAVAKIAGRAA